MYGWSSTLDSGFMGYDLPTGKEEIFWFQNVQTHVPNGGWRYNHIQLYWTGWSPDDSIQLASMMATVANEGYYYTPHIIKN
jgi:penicillin-binding protein 2